MEQRRDKQDLIIKKAMEAFLEKGLYKTVMDDIADKVGLTRRTLYRYFRTKEELAYETTIMILNEWNEYQDSLFNQLEGSGIEKLEYFLTSLMYYMNDRMEIVKYLGEFDFYFAENIYTEPSEDCKTRYDDIILKSEKILGELMDIGQEDQSIKSDINVKLMIATMSSLLWGFGQRIAIRGSVIEKETGFRGIDIIKNQISIYIMAIKEDTQKIVFK